jgi:hypothetical protein
VPVTILSLAAVISATNIKYESLITVKLAMSQETVTGGIIHDNSFQILKNYAEYTISQRKCNNTPVMKLLNPYIMGQNV